MADIHIRLDEELLQKFKSACAWHGRTMSDVLRGFMTEVVEQQDVDRWGIIEWAFCSQESDE